MPTGITKNAVMAGAGPATHVFDLPGLTTWMPATSAGMTSHFIYGSYTMFDVGLRPIQQFEGHHENHRRNRIGPGADGCADPSTRGEWSGRGRDSRRSRGWSAARIRGAACAASARLLLPGARLCAPTARLRGADTIVLFYARRNCVGQLQRHVGAATRSGVRLVRRCQDFES